MQGIKLRGGEEASFGLGDIIRTDYVELDVLSGSACGSSASGSATGWGGSDGGRHRGWLLSQKRGRGGGRRDQSRHKTAAFHQKG